MSMDYCHSCDTYIDTDFDCEFYDDGKSMCAGCRERKSKAEWDAWFAKLDNSAMGKANAGFINLQNELVKIAETLKEPRA
jgi:hypothetical protein